MATTGSYVDEAVKRLQQRAGQAKASAAETAPGSGAPRTTVNDTTARPRSIIGRARELARRPVKPGDFAKLGKKALRAGGRAYAPLAGVAAVSDSFEPDSTARYAKRFGMDEPTGDYSAGDIARFTALRGLGFASDLANAMTFGAAGTLFRDKDMPSQQDDGPVREASAAEPDAQPPDQMRQPEQPAGQDGGRMPAADGKVDLGAMLDDPKFVPPRGTGIIRNQRTGRTRAVAGNPDQPQQATVQQEEQPTNRKVDMPNLALAMDASTLPQYMAQFSTATQQAADNRRRTANRKGIIARQKGRQDLEKGEQDLSKGKIEISQLKQLEQVLSELHTLDDSNDPQGTRRAELTELALTLQGKKPGSRFEFKTTRDTDEVGFPIQQIIRVNPRTGKAELVDPGAQQGAAPNAGNQGAGQFEEGKVYQDANGNKARRVNGQWEPL